MHHTITDKVACLQIFLIHHPSRTRVLTNTNKKGTNRKTTTSRDPILVARIYIVPRGVHRSTRMTRLRLILVGRLTVTLNINTTNVRS